MDGMASLLREWRQLPHQRLSLTTFSTERASAPVGTTVKVTDFFKYLPVRKQAALKHSLKWLAKIRRLMQAYTLARPAVRFSLRVLKAKSKTGDFVYAPKKDANVEDAAFKVIGKDCALQCDWTAIEAGGFDVTAFLPRPDCTGSKIANEGAFISVDARPILASRGTAKQIVTTFKERLRKANAALGSVSLIHRYASCSRCCG
jgi:DNA mismatch repair ATPase MutL